MSEDSTHTATLSRATEGDEESMHLADFNQKQKVRSLPQSSPSDPDFDRTKLTDCDYIELLLFETKELKATISEYERRLHKLKAKTQQGGSVSLEDFEGLKLGPTGATDEIPQRSARRRKQSSNEVRNLETNDKALKRESIASITLNDPVDIDYGVPISESFKTELSEAISSPHTPHFAFSDGKAFPPSSTLESKASTTASLVSDATFDNDGNASSLSWRGNNSDQDMPRKQLDPHRVPSGSGSYKSRIRLTDRSRQSDHLSEIETSQESIPRHSSSTSHPRNDHSNTASPHTPDDLPMETDAASPISTAGSSAMALSRNDVSGSVAPRTPVALKTPIVEEESTLDATNAESTGSTPISYFSQKKTSDFVTTPTTQLFKSSDSISTSERPSSQTPGSSFHVINNSSTEEEDVPLFIKPDDFYTIRIKVVSTISINAKKSDDPNCTFSINDKDTDKEMWRIRKTYSQISSFDKEIRPVLEFFGLPSIPDRSVFNSTTPTKVDSRMRALQDYFDSIFVIPHVPQAVLQRICRYISLNFVNPLDDFKSGARKEGFLIRRYKGLGTSWKTRWCSIDGPTLEIYDLPGGSLIEQIKLHGSQIGRQSSDIVAEERGYRHAFLILESSKSSKISGSYPKHFFCAESDKERDDWIAAMVEFTENDPLSNPETQAQHDQIGTPQTLPGSSSASLLTLPQDRLDHTPYSQSAASPNSKASLADVSILEETDPKESKKIKMRSIFPFRTKVIQEEPGLVESQRTSSWNPSENTIDSYLESMNLSEEPARAVFGRELSVAFNYSNHEFNGLFIPSICYRCLDFLTKAGAIYEEGIFRLSGSASTIRQLKEKFNNSFDLDLFECSLKPDIHSVSGLLKTYLRELPEPVFGIDIYNGLQRLMTEMGPRVAKSKLSIMMKNYLKTESHIDRVHYDFCVTIFGFLRSVIAKSAINKMSLKNLCIVFVPTLNISVEVLSHCLIDYDCIFGTSEPVKDSCREVIDLQIPVF